MEVSYARLKAADHVLIGHRIVERDLSGRCNQYISAYLPVNLGNLVEGSKEGGRTNAYLHRAGSTEHCCDMFPAEPLPGSHYPSSEGHDLHVVEFAEEEEVARP